MTARILVIEDNPANLELMCYLLQAFGYTPITACNGEDGLEAARRDQPDLILCDIQMPTKNGFEVARELKDHSTLKTVPLVAVTALAMVGDREKVLIAGFDGYIAKPIDPETFVGQVEEFLRSDQRHSPVPSPDTTTTDATAFVLCLTAHRRILVVDDEPVNLTLKRSILEPMGYFVETADGMEMALAMARRTPPDLIISDVNMPGGNGFAFIRKVKADPVLSSIPFLFITSSAQDERSRAMGISLGATRFLFRPIEPLALLDEIETCMRVRKEP